MIELTAEDLHRCCGSSRWVAQMLERQPFAGEAELRRAADEIWLALDTADWLEAFSAHPKIGARKASGFSAGEQAGLAAAERATRDALAEGNRAYDAKFGFVFLICATGKSADEMLAALRERLDNDRDTELRNAAEEQRKITQLRLDKVIA